MNTSLFCDHCGAANASPATVCFACHQPLPAPQPAPAPQTQVQAHVSVEQAALVSPPPAAPSVPGSLLNLRYHLISEIGQGGFGRVYKAQDRQKRNKVVAIKQIDLHHLSPREIIEATDTYNREMSLLSTLNHAHLPRIYDHFTDPEHWYLVMDFIEGETLADYLNHSRRVSLPVKEVLALGMQLCTVLAYLHTRPLPIIFRDVKPANIMRTPTGQLYLIDFGIARHFTPGQRKDTGPLGSPGYAAPEQYGKAQTTVQTDIYGLGETLHTLLTGVEPFETAGGATSSLPPRRLPKQLQQLLNQMCEPDANKRPESMDEVKRRLQQIKGDRAAFLWGPLIGSIGSMAYVLIISFRLLVTLFSHYGLDNFDLANLTLAAHSLSLLWPQVSEYTGIVSSFMGLYLLFHRPFSPRTRLMGLGILAMEVLLLIGIRWGWIPSP